MIPEPGIHYNIPDAEYRAWPCVNISSLIELLPPDGTPADYLYALDNPYQSPAMALGTATHVAVLQPDLFKATYVCGPDCRRGTKQWDAAEAEAGSNGSRLVKPDEYNQAVAMGGAVRGHAGSAEYLMRGAAEVSFVWKDSITGLLCKGRIDWVAGFVLVDLKTTMDLSWRFLERRIAEHHYAARAAFYLDGLQSVTGDEYGPFVHIWVRNKNAPLVRCTYLRKRDIKLGRFQYQSCLDVLAECKRTKQWPGYGDDVRPIGVPAWAIPEGYDLITGGMTND